LRLMGIFDTSWVSMKRYMYYYTYGLWITAAVFRLIRDRSLFMAGVATKRNVFLGKNFADPTIKMSIFYQPQISIKK
jgi:hypothetical protein